MNSLPPGERRRFTRVGFDAKALIDVGGESVDTELIDISFKGALVTLPAAGLPSNSGRATLKIRGPNDSFEIRAQVGIAHARHERLALLITEIDLESMTHLRRLIELNTGDEDMVHRELSALADADHAKPG